MRAHSKQNTSKRHTLRRESHWICNANMEPHKTLRLRSETTSNTQRATIPAQGHRKQHIARHPNHTFDGFPNGTDFSTRPSADRAPTSADRDDRTNTTRTRNGNPSLRIREKACNTNTAPGRDNAKITHCALWAGGSALAVELCEFCKSSSKIATL